MQTSGGRRATNAFPPLARPVTLVAMGYAILALVLCMIGFMVARYGFGAVTMSDDGNYAGMTRGAWKIVGILIVAAGLLVALVGLLR